MSFKFFGTNIHVGFMFAAVIMLLLIFDKSNAALFTLMAATLHEIAHLVCFIRFGRPPQKVDLGALGMKMDRGPYDINLSLKKEAFTALAGPLTNIIIAILTLPLYHFAWAKQVVLINVALAVFNALPIFELDGGRALYYILCDFWNNQVAQKVLDIASVATLFFLYLIGALVLISSGYNFTLIAATVYLTVLTITKRYM